MLKTFQKSTKITFGIIILLAFLCEACLQNTGHENDAHIDTISSLIEEGDIVFRRGEGMMSRIVLIGDVGGEYSHIGMVVSDEGNLKIAHAVPGEPDYEGDFDRVKLDALETFFSKHHASRGAVVRLELNAEQKATLSHLAITKANKKIEFDHNYNLTDTTKLYCTEFLQLVYSNIGINLNEGRKTTAFIPGMQGDYIMPSDIYKNKNLKKIYSF